ncbi:phage infection protein [Enterococcus florum]|uniref:Phage infection protein n=1 Tax=Enterococcus florum TaxID=2480627 RepID=A0A4P5P7E9_9ENTE|nr:YhgE/Pip domain-containing protein [Enterococcus florum]GCF93887.1 phage infection protein [Enterococcus florum]
MKSIKQTFELYRLDWRRIFKNPIAVLLMIALMIIPSLYAWFNIKALWDPYSNTGELPIAVYSADAGASFQDKDVEIGDQVIDNLHENKQLGWQFVDSKDQLVEGVKSGKYYAGIYLPKEFSEDLLSFTSGNIKRPKIEYYLNQKINAIAPKITDKGASSLQQEISQEFIQTASSTLLKVFNEIGYDIDENLVSINKVKDLILKTNDNLDEIDQYTQEVVEVHGKLPELKQKLDQANQMKQYLPQIDEAGQKLVALNQKFPELKRQASVILTLQQKIPEIQQAGQQLATVDSDFANIQQTLTDGINEAKQGLQVIQQVQQILPDVEQLGQNAAQFAGTSKEAAEKLQQAVPSIANSVSVTLSAVGSIADNTSSIADTIGQAVSDDQLTPEERDNIKKVLTDFSNNLAAQQTALNDTAAFLGQLQAEAGNQDLQPIIDQINHLASLLGDIKTRTDQLIPQIDTISTDDLVNLFNQISSLGQQVSQTVSAINVQEVENTVNTLLTQLISTISNAQDLLQKAQAIDFNSLLSSTEKTVANAIPILEKYQQQMPAIGQEVHDANVLLNGNMDTIVNGINTGASLYNNELPVVEQKLGLAASFIQNDWPGVKNDINNGLDLVNQKMPEVESALNAATDLIQNDWPAIKNGIQRAATAIDQGDQTIDFGEVLKLLKLDAQQESEFFTEPVEIATNTIYPIANNGSASAPFYTALCLWVGAVLFSSVTTTDFYLDKKDRKKYTKREQFGARLLTYMTMGIAQALVVSLGNYFLLGVDVRNPLLSVLFALLVVMAFTMMVYVLVALFGTVGKGIAIIILVLSISGGGGNYPIQVSGKFFQAINPWLPFTHAVNLLRESAGGVYWPNARTDILILCFIIVLFGVVGTWAYPILQPKLAKLTKISHESKIFH